MAAFVEDFDMDGFEHVADITGQIWAAYGVAAQPSYVFINDNGETRRHIGGLETDEFEAELIRLIGT